MYDPIADWKREAVESEGRSFPETMLLPLAEAVKVRQRIFSAIGLSPGASNREALDSLYACAQRLTQNPQMIDGVAIEKVLEEAQVRSESLLLVFPLGSAFESAVRIARADFVAFFDDLWYPSTDDLVVIDAANHVLLLVDHHENIGTLRLGEEHPGRA